jgi:hypothetical protein
VGFRRGEALCLAQQSCSQCFGLGYRELQLGPSVVCRCVYCAVFRICYKRFRKAVESEPKMSRGHSDFSAGSKNSGSTRSSAATGPARRRRWGYPNAEYIADFLAIARRELGSDSIGYQVFSYHFLLGADWKVCSLRLGIDRGNFFHEVYRVQTKLGRAFREVQPFALYPLDEYFGSLVNRQPKQPEKEAPPKKALRFPLRERAFAAA